MSQLATHLKRLLLLTLRETCYDRIWLTISAFTEEQPVTGYDQGRVTELRGHDRNTSIVKKDTSLFE